jgi:hypothetical protein
MFLVAIECYQIVAADLPAHPFVLANTSEVETLRHELAGKSWKSEVYRAERDFCIMPTGAGLRCNADLWLKRTIRIPTRGGHFHNFFCEDGNRLEVPADQTFRAGPYRCPKCGRVYAGEKYEAALRCVAHHWLAVAAHDLALVSAIEQNQVYGRKAAEILLKYADAYPGPHTKALEGGILFQSLNEAMWVIPLAQAYDLVYDLLTPTERARVETFLLTVAKGLRQCESRGNWQSWHLSAVGVIGYATKNRELISYARGQFKSQIRDDLGDDGLWPESVHTYHFFALNAFVYLAEAAWHAGEDLYHWEAEPGKSLLSMFRAPLPYAYPNFRLPAINDGWFEAFVPPDIYELGFARTHEPLFGWVIANDYRKDVVPAGTTNTRQRTMREGIYAFVFGQEMPTQMESPIHNSVNFPVLGICALRSTNGTMMTFDYGPFLGHGQRDKMGITLFANGKLWAADYGTPGYGASILRWYQSTFAHNTIVVDGKSQNPTKENDASLWLGDSSCEAVRSETSEAYPGVTHSREVVRAGDYFVIIDRLASKMTHTYDFYLHSEGDLKLQGGSAKGAVREPPVEWIEQMVFQGPSKSVSGEWRDKNAGLAFWISGSSEVTPITAKCPAETGARKIPLLIARQVAKQARFTTVLFPLTGSAGLRVEENRDTISIRDGKSETSINIPSDGGRPHLMMTSSLSR